MRAHRLHVMYLLVLSALTGKEADPLSLCLQWADLNGRPTHVTDLLTFYARSISGVGVWSRAGSTSGRWSSAARATTSPTMRRGVYALRRGTPETERGLTCSFGTEDS